MRENHRASGRGLSRAAFFAVLLAGLAIAVALFSSPAYAQPPVASPPAADAVPQAADPAQALVEKHTPIVYVGEQAGECDTGGESVYPSGVEMVLGREGVTLKRGAERELIKEMPTAADLYQGDEELWLDIPGDPKRPGCDYEEFFRNGPEEAKNITYSRVVLVPERNAVIVQFWFYYVFNNWNNTHESDWEFIQLYWDASSVEEALSRPPDELGYSQHSGGERATWDDDKLDREGDRPIVYVARGSHANQFRSDLLVGKGEDGAGFGCDDSRPPLIRLDLTTRLLPETASGPEDPAAWITYQGRWGERRSSELNGPTGPNTKQQWDEPMSFQDDLRDTNVTVPEWNGPGISATDTFCGLVKWGSILLIRGGLWLTLGLVGLIAVSTWATIRRTDFRPANIQPLRIRRRFGQILAAAARTESNLWRLFLGVGAIFIPVGLITLALQEVILRFTPVENVLEVADSVPAKIAVALALGATQFGITYWLTLCVVVAALNRLADRGNATAVDAFKDTWAKAGSLIKARGLALLALVGLSITVVGIPLAVWLGTRWLFLEQAILHEDADAHTARKRSAQLVHGHYLYAVGAIVAIAGLGLLIGPVIGAFMVLLTSASLTAINLVSAIFYTVLVPWVAICFTMLFWSMAIRYDEEHPEASDPDSTR